ncbi:MAG: hypothetical protein AAFR21_15945 [Pseudomonadota bacterium]
MTPSLEAEKRDIIRRQFLNTADQTYIVARWCFLNRLYLDFYWNAAHCVEKYLKAALLMNGQSAIRDGSGKSYGHDVPRLYWQVCKFADELMPDTLECPANLNVPRWQDEKPRDFLNRLSVNGEPNNRYNLRGFVKRCDDLHKLDIVVHAIRRAVQPLNDPHFSSDDRKRRATTDTNLEFALKHPSHQPGHLHSRFYKLTNGKAGEDVRNAGLTQNLPFAPADFDHGELLSGFAAENPILGLRILETVERPPSKQDGLMADLADWAMANIYYPPAVKKQLEEASKTLRKRSTQSASPS